MSTEATTKLATAGGAVKMLSKLGKGDLSVLEKLGEQGAEKLNFSELRYVYDIFCSFGMTHVEVSDAEELAHTMHVMAVS